MMNKISLILALTSAKSAFASMDVDNEFQLRRRLQDLGSHLPAPVSQPVEEESAEEEAELTEWQQYYEDSLGLEDKRLNALWYIQDVHCERELLKKELNDYKAQRKALRAGEAEKRVELRQKMGVVQEEMKALTKLQKRKSRTYKKLGGDVESIDLSDELCEALYKMWEELGTLRRLEETNDGLIL